MAMMQYRPSTDVFGSFLEDFMNRPSGSRMGNLLRAPETDVLETESEIQVTVEMPGMKPDDIDIALENNILTISGEKQEHRTKGDENGTWHLSERRYGKFNRSFVLPADVESDQIDARFEDGVLRVQIPKSAKARRRKIEVRGDGGKRNVEVESGE